MLLFVVIIKDNLKLHNKTMQKQSSISLIEKREKSSQLSFK